MRESVSHSANQRSKQSPKRLHMHIIEKDVLDKLYNT